MNRQYEKGTRQERAIKTFLESKGWNVSRSAGSHGIDLIAVKQDKHNQLGSGKILFISSKAFHLSDNQKHKQLDALIKGGYYGAFVSKSMILTDTWKEDLDGAFQ